MAFPKIVGKETLRFNTLITSDKEPPLISGIRGLIKFREKTDNFFPLEGMTSLFPVELFEE